MEDDIVLRSSQQKSQSPQKLSRDSLLEALQQSETQEEETDSLLGLAARQRADSINMIHDSIQKRLAEELDQTVRNFLREHPQLRGQYYIGILSKDDAISVEVIPLEDAVQAVKDVSAEEARTVMKQQPMGYYDAVDFTLKTPDKAPYQDFKKEVQGYFTRNAATIRYLRENPQGVSASSIARQMGL